MTATLSDTEASLLAEIRGDESTPFDERMAMMRDDAPRLWYSDWLEEREGIVKCERCKGYGEKWHRVRAGHAKDGSMNWKPFDFGCVSCDGSGHVSNGNAARAEFIRVQVEAHRLNNLIEPYRQATGPEIIVPRSSKQCREWKRLCDLERPVRLRYADLLQEWEQKWLGEFLLKRGSHVFGDFGGERVAEEINRRRTNWYWDRGFISHITCTEANWLAHGPAIVRAPACAVERVTLSDKRPQNYPNNGGPIKYGWYRGLFVRYNDEFSLPEEIWNRLLGGENYGPWIDYDSVQAALDALIRAGVEWAWERKT